MFTTIYYKHVKENQICSLIDNIDLSCIAYHPVIVSHVKKCNIIPESVSILYRQILLGFKHKFLLITRRLYRR